MQQVQGLDTEWVYRLLTKQFHDAKPVNLTNISIESAVPKGDNYTTDVFRVKLKTITATGSPKTFSIIVKLAKTPEKTQEFLANFSLFRDEAKVYATSIKRMEELIDEFNDKRETLWAKMYGFQPYNSIVFEDLKDLNYTMIDRTAWQGLDYALLVLRAVGRFHAMSKVLISRGIISNDDKGNFWATAGNPLNDKLIQGAFGVMSEAMIENLGSWKSGWEAIGRRIRAKRSTLPAIIASLYSKYDEKFRVLNHGDLWTTNMMFKHTEYTNIPIAVKFLDFQFPHLNSFIWDVLYYMYISVVPSVRRAHKELLLKAYHESLLENLKFFNYKGYIVTWDDVLSEEKRVSPAKLTFLFSFMSFTSSTVKDPFIMENLVTDRPEDAFNQLVFIEEKFVREVSGDLEEFAKEQLI
ncbi:transferase activity, transferring phosphorus-containing groups [Nesidiocoris tenuis]|uniref:Transferase activity, transferring phosphorus-containing groups n=1 Tax=Nesidiocoris tenuis TaxID=355587 RepID=A0ABN7AUB0_9HEMI|nr:transferase activity, transferring phosphorus-containing groups [Nesidiocoris tenuis]